VSQSFVLNIKYKVKHCIRYLDKTGVKYFICIKLMLYIELQSLNNHNLYEKYINSTVISQSIEMV